MSDNNSFSLRKLGKFVKKLRIESNSILLIKANTPLSEIGTLENITEALNRTKLEDVLILVVDDLDEVCSLSEREMNKHGWYRIKTFQSLLSKSAKKDANDGKEEHQQEEEEFEQSDGN